MQSKLITMTYLSLWSSDESVPLEQLNEGNLSLQQSQPHPNTAAWTKTKGHVAQLRPFGFFFRCKPICKVAKIIREQDYTMGNGCSLSVIIPTILVRVLFDPTIPT